MISTKEEKVIQFLAKNYNPLLYISKLVSLLQNFYPSKDFNEYSKFELHQLISETVIENYPGESLLKYKLSQRFLKKKNVVAAFEIRVNNSRADFLTVNGHTTSFEIKSAYDNFSKFSKQASDYLSVFEFNYLVVDERHLSRAFEILPEFFGLWSFKNGKYKQVRKSSFNMQMNPEVQLTLLTRKELTVAFPDSGGVPKIILNQHDAPVINERFKKSLKSRYRTRWNFLVDNQARILPVDLQFFFNTNVDPAFIYHH